MMLVLDDGCLAQRPVPLRDRHVPAAPEATPIGAASRVTAKFFFNPLRAHFSEPTFGFVDLTDALRSDKCNDRQYFLLSGAVAP